MAFIKLLLGFLCGIAATGPMSAVMVAIHRRLPESERYSLPPREITTKAIEAMPGEAPQDPQLRSALTWLAHFGYGGAAGALYAGVQSVGPRAPEIRGSLFGLLVWTVSYLGLMPALGVLRPATEHPVRRSALMIVAHLVWGCVLAGLYETFLRDAAEKRAAFDDSPEPQRDRA